MVQPLTEELRRLSVTVSARFLKKLAAGRGEAEHREPPALRRRT